MRYASNQTKSPLSILKTSETRVKAFLVRYETLGRGEGLKKKQVLHRLRQNLDIQLELEGGFLYPAIRSLNQASALRFVSGALRNHEEIKGLLKDLTRLEVAHRPLDLKMDELRKCVLRHLGLERFQIASLLRMLSGNTLRDLSDEMREARDRLHWKPSPQGEQILYPTLQSQDGAPEDDVEKPSSLKSEDGVRGGKATDFDNWGSE